MASSLIFVPVSGGSTVTCAPGLNIVSLRGTPLPLGVEHVSIGGKAYNVTFDSYYRYDVTFAPLTYPQTSNNVELAQLWAWIAHAQRGGEFAFAVDSTKTWATTLSGAEAQAQTALSITSATGIANGDQVYLEDVNDPTIWEKQEVDSTSAGPLLNIDSPGLNFSYASGSVVRYAEYFPACILDPIDQQPFIERDGGAGANLWDLAFSFRTVR